MTIKENLIKEISESIQEKIITEGAEAAAEVVAEAAEAPVMPEGTDTTVATDGTGAVIEEAKKNDDPCWDGHEQVGMKKKDGKEVPNCVPKSEDAPIVEARDKENEKMKDDSEKGDDMAMKESIDPVDLSDVMSTLEVSLSEDQKASLFEGVELSEDLKASVASLFESVCTEKCKYAMEKSKEKMTEAYNKAMKDNTEKMEKKAKVRMEAVADRWLKENQIALEGYTRLRLHESFMSGLKDLFESHYIEVPQAKLDVIERLQEKVERLEEKYSKAVDANLALQESIEARAREDILAEATKDLTDVKADKVKSLVEGIKFDSNEDYASKVKQLVESVVAVKEVIAESETAVAKVETIDDLQKRIIEFARSSR